MVSTAGYPKTDWRLGCTDLDSNFRLGCNADTNTCRIRRLGTTTSTDSRPCRRLGGAANTYRFDRRLGRTTGSDTGR